MKLDLSHAYQQLILDEGCKKYCTVNTHKGLFQPTCLQYGLRCVAGIFETGIEKCLNHVSFTVSRMDNILISGKNYSEHFHQRAF